MTQSRAAFARLLTCAAFALAFAAAPAQASLLGQSIEGFAFIGGNTNFNLLNNTVSPPSPAGATIADPGLEYTMPIITTNFYTLDFTGAGAVLTLHVDEDVGSLGVGDLVAEFTLPNLGGSGQEIVGFNVLSSDIVSCPVFPDNCLTPPLVAIGTSFGPDSLSFSMGSLHLSYFPAETTALGDQRLFTATFEILLSSDPQPTPEPGALALFAAGLGLLAASRPRRRERPAG